MSFGIFGVYYVGFNLAVPPFDSDEFRQAIGHTIDYDTIVNTILAVLGRAVPQMNMFVLSFPVTIGAGLISMSLAMPFTLALFETEFMTLVETILALLKGLGHG